MRPLIRNVVAGLALILAGCNSDGTTDTDPNPVPVLDQDVALEAADAAGQDVAIMGGPDVSLGIPGFDNQFACRTHDGVQLTVVRTCTFKDAAGNVQAAYDANTTASVTIHVEIEGEVSHEGWSASIQRDRELVVSGLAGNETTRTWNGNGSSEASRSRHTEGSDDVRTYDVSSTLTITNVVIPVNRTDNSWPLSGTVTTQVTVKIVGGPHDGETHQRSATLTFNGTRLVPIVVNGTTFTFDLRTRRIVGSDK